MISQRYNFEEKANRESTLVGELRELLEKRQKEGNGCTAWLCHMRV